MFKCVFSLARPTPVRKDETEITKVRVGDATQLECTAEGNPQPTIEWIRSGTVIRKEKIKNYKISIENKTTHMRSSYLSINDVSSKDNGTYICRSSNSEGQTDQTLQLIVQGKVRSS